MIIVKDKNVVFATVGAINCLMRQLPHWTPNTAFERAQERKPKSLRLLEEKCLKRSAYHSIQSIGA